MPSAWFERGLKPSRQTVLASVACRKCGAIAGEPCSGTRNLANHLERARDCCRVARQQLLRKHASAYERVVLHGEAATLVAREAGVTRTAVHSWCHREFCRRHPSLSLSARGILAMRTVEGVASVSTLARSTVYERVVLHGESAAVVAAEYGVTPSSVQQRCFTEFKRRHPERTTRTKKGLRFMRAFEAGG